MLNYEIMRLTAKYLNEYTEFCKQGVCGPGCPVYDEHEKLVAQGAKTSCFMTYCQMREDNRLKAPN